MKKLLTILACLLTLSAQAEPVFKRPVTIVTNASVGQGPDVVLRSLTSQLEKTWGRPVIIENRPGANGAIALEHYVKEMPNDNILYYGDISNFVNMPLLFHKEALLDTIKPLTPVYNSPFIVIAPAGKSDLKEFEKNVRGKQFYGSWGVGSLAHLCGAAIADKYGIPAVHAPYKDVGIWLNDVAQNNLSFSCSTVGTTEGLAKAGKLSYVATTSSRRNPTYPDMPTVKEAFGIELAQPMGWLGIYVGKGMSKAKADQITRDIKTAIKTGPVQTTISAMNGENFDPTTQEFERMFAQDRVKVKRAFEKFKISID
jgi:tripartite-type tricarboxylate transporter receptor subunit TctC